MKALKKWILRYLGVSVFEWSCTFSNDSDISLLGATGSSVWLSWQD